ncbi:MAG TPA: T9SS type A sorting domain-containing protein, partial [Chitinophagales bacterium]|nr:T9SS type A sorting domain-containing protein [Chitinophagales bacterium]
NTSGNTTAGNGTSYSSPLLAGLVTCLWQADRSKNNMEIIQAVERSASQYDNPDDAMGYGLPDFHVAMADLGVYIDKIESNPNRSFLYPNPFNTELNVYYYATANTNVSIQLLDTSGKILQAQQQYVTEGTPYRFLLDAWQNYPKGIYLVKIIDGDNQQLLQAIKMAD